MHYLKKMRNDSAISNFMESITVPEADPATLLDAWIHENQDRITKSVLTAFGKVDGVADALTDTDAEGREATKHKIEGLITAGHGVLPEYIGEAFHEEFVDQLTLREALVTATQQIARDNINMYVELLLDQAHSWGTIPS
jgi:hypothetical protein